MSDHQDIRDLAGKLEELSRSLRGGGLAPSLSIDETAQKVTEAVSLYRKFRAHFSGSRFDVVSVARAADGTVSEKPFDWEALDRVVSPR